MAVQLYYTLYDWISDKIEPCGDKKYTSQTHCCTPKGPMWRDRIKNLADCEERHQYRPKEKPKATGCMVTWSERFHEFGEHNNPTGGKNTSFYDACQEHNKCYADCGRNKPGEPGVSTRSDEVHQARYCDPQFVQLLEEACKKAVDLKETAKCRVKAGEYYMKIVSQHGAKLHAKAQKENCTCCAPGQK